MKPFPNSYFKTFVLYLAHVHIARPLPFHQDVEARIFVSGTRHDGYIDFKPSGQVLEVHKN